MQHRDAALEVSLHLGVARRRKANLTETVVIVLGKCRRRPAPDRNNENEAQGVIHDELIQPSGHRLTAIGNLEDLRIMA
jgi:hypothetical protein